MFLQRFLIPIAVTIDMSFAADNVRGIRRVVSDTAEPTNIDDNMSMIAAVFEEEPENEMFSDATADEDPVIDTNTDRTITDKPAADGSSVIEELISSIVGATDVYIQTLKGYLAPSSASVVPTAETMSKGGKTVSSGDDAVVMNKSVFSKSSKSKSSKTSEPTMFPTLSPTLFPTLAPTLFSSGSGKSGKSGSGYGSGKGGKSGTDDPTMFPTLAPTLDTSKSSKRSKVKPSFSKSSKSKSSKTSEPTMFPTLAPTLYESSGKSGKSGSRGSSSIAALVEEELQVSITEQGTNGTCTVVNNKVVYNPNSGFFGNDSCKYQVCTIEASLPKMCDDAVIDITVGEVVDSPPVAVNDVAETLEDSQVIIDILANDE